MLTQSPHLNPVSYFLGSKISTATIFRYEINFKFYFLSKFKGILLSDRTIDFLIYNYLLLLII